MHGFELQAISFFMQENVAFELRQVQGAVHLGERRRRLHVDAPGAESLDGAREASVVRYLLLVTR